MSRQTESESTPLARAVLRGAFATLGLTTLHHAYGAWRYHTPWRNHVALVALVAGSVLYSAYALYRRNPRGRSGRIAGWALAGGTVLFPVLVIGGFEGLYNHGVKDLLYFAGAPHDLLLRLFPPPKYELPNDALFELSGVLQGAVGAFAGVAAIRFARDRRSFGAGLIAPTTPPTDL